MFVSCQINHLYILMNPELIVYLLTLFIYRQAQWVDIS